MGAGERHECGFPAAGCTPEDLLGTLRAFTALWREMMAGLDDEVLAAPGPAGPSVFDHLDAARAAITAARDQVRAEVDAARAADGAAPVDGSAGTAEPARAAGVAGFAGSGSTAPSAPRTARAAVAALDRAIAALNAAAGRAEPALWAAPSAGARDGAPPSIAAVVGEAVHEGVHRVHAGGRLVHGWGGGAPSQQGRVAQLSASGGGVPKQPVLTGSIDDRGLAGDRQAERRIHGRPYQAVSLWSAEVIEALQAEGHGVYPGAAGENVTVAGIDWPTVRPGVRILLGGALVEVSGFATPCAKNARWFVDRAIDRIDQRRHPGWSRAYAWVLRPGQVGPGDPALVEPPPSP